MKLQKMKTYELKDFYDAAYPYYQTYCNISEKTPEKRKNKWIQTSDKIWDAIKKEPLRILNVSLQYEELEENVLSASWMKQHRKPDESIKAGYLYAIFMEDKELPQVSVLEKFYYEMWYGAVIMAAKDLVYKELEDVNGSEYKLSVSYAPGFDDIPCERLADWITILDPEHRYLSVNADMVIGPANSLVGIYFGYEHI